MNMSVESSDWHGEHLLLRDGAFSDPRPVVSLVPATMTSAADLYRRSVRYLGVVLVLLVACGSFRETGTSDVAGDAGENLPGAIVDNALSRDAGSDVEGDSTRFSEVDSPCHVESSSTLPGVRIEFTTSLCAWTLAEVRAGVQIDYWVRIDADVKGVVPLPQDAGECDEPGPSGLILFEELAGDGQRYGMYDKGLCEGPLEESVTLRSGSYSGTFQWDGRNWSGPSDTGAQKGDPFPPGVYTLTVSAWGRLEDEAGATAFKVAGSLRVRLRE